VSLLNRIRTKAEFRVVLNTKLRAGLLALDLFCNLGWKLEGINLLPPSSASVHPVGDTQVSREVALYFVYRGAPTEEELEEQSHQLRAYGITVLAERWAGTAP
jgi:hypothetical protein